MKKPSKEPNYWSSAANHYGNWGSPLSPVQEDMDVLQREMLDVASANQSARLKVLQLGVTPGISRLDWPADTDLVSVDRCKAMIDTLWSGSWPKDKSRVTRRVMHRDWLDLNGSDGRFHLVVSDGPFHNMPDIESYGRLSDVLYALLQDRGRLVTRFFTQPTLQESPHLLFERMLAGEFPSFHTFKFCLLMALQPNPDLGTRLNDVWEFWSSLDVDHEELARQRGWPVAAVDTMNAYRGKQSRLCFLTAERVKQLLSARFEIVNEYVPRYPLGDRCPIYTLQTA